MKTNGLHGLSDSGDATSLQLVHATLSPRTFLDQSHRRNENLSPCRLPPEHLSRNAGKTPRRRNQSSMHPNFFAPRKTDWTWTSTAVPLSRRPGHDVDVSQVTGPTQEEGWTGEELWGCDAGLDSESGRGCRFSGDVLLTLPRSPKKPPTCHLDRTPPSLGCRWEQAVGFLSTFPPPTPPSHTHPPGPSLHLQ